MRFWLNYANKIRMNSAKNVRSPRIESIYRDDELYITSPENESFQKNNASISHRHDMYFSSGWHHCDWFRFVIWSSGMSTYPQSLRLKLWYLLSRIMAYLKCQKIIPVKLNQHLPITILTSIFRISTYVSLKSTIITISNVK